MLKSISYEIFQDGSPDDTLREAVTRFEKETKLVAGEAHFEYAYPAESRSARGRWVGIKVTEKR